MMVVRSRISMGLINVTRRKGHGSAARGRRNRKRTMVKPGGPLDAWAPTETLVVAER
jgi:hypothetical protein